MIMVHYIQYIKYLIFKISLESKTLKFIKVRRQKSSFCDNVLGGKVVGKNRFIVDSISTDKSSVSVLFGVLFCCVFW